MKPLRIALLVHEDCIPPETIEGLSDEEMAPFKTEYDVLATLEGLGHEVRTVAVAEDLAPLREAHDEWRPHVVFNLLEEFHGTRICVPYLLGYLELVGQPYTGCNPRGMILAHSKGLSKRILRSHRVRVPDFATFPLGRRVRRPRRLAFPLLVKSATEHGSVGIAQASIVRDDESLVRRVERVHEGLDSDAIAEQYIEGREFYVGVLGNRRLETFPVWELTFENLPDAAPNIATAKVKWDAKYQKRAGVKTSRPTDLSEELRRRMQGIARRVFRILAQSGYARVDFRLTPEGEIYVLECNPNPQLAYGEDFAESAHSMGMDYERLLARIVSLGRRYTIRSE